MFFMSVSSSFLSFFFAKHILVGHLFRNMHPSDTIYLLLSLSHNFTSLQFYKDLSDS